MDIVSLNSFDNFAETDQLSTLEVIRRDLFNYLTVQVGSTPYLRGSGGVFLEAENETNSGVLDMILQMRVVEAVGKYNEMAQADYRVAVGFDMGTLDTRWGSIATLKLTLIQRHWLRGLIGQQRLTLTL